MTVKKNKKKISDVKEISRQKVVYVISSVK